jgi:hypothetical protein
MKKLLVTFLPAVFATVLNAQITASEMATIIATGNKFIQENKRQGDILNKVPDFSQGSSSGNLFFCDSIHGYMFNQYADSSLDYKYTYSYDLHGNQSTFAQYVRDHSTNQWIIGLKDTTAYVSKDKLAFERMLYWDTNTKTLSGGWGYDHTFDANGNQIATVEYKMDTQSNQFVLSHKSESSCNSTGQLDSIMFYDWDPVIGNWEIASRWISTYDSDNILILSMNYNWDATANQWINSQKTDVGHDSSGNLTMRLTYNWDNNISQWIKTDSLVLAFNGFGDFTMMAQYNWDVIADRWIGIWKTEEIYDGQRHIVTSLNYQWNSNNNQWVYDYKSDESYDANGNVVLDLLYTYDILNNKWIPNSKSEYYYEENGLQYLRIFSSFNNDYWFLGSKYYYYNSVHVLTDLVNPATAGSLVIYPNPAKEWINIQSKDPLTNGIQLYNHKGQFLKSVNIEPGLNTIHISNLESGLYFIKILSKPSETYKFIKTE